MFVEKLNFKRIRGEAFLPDFFLLSFYLWSWSDRKPLACSNSAHSCCSWFVCTGLEYCNLTNFFGVKCPLLWTWLEAVFFSRIFFRSPCLRDYWIGLRFHLFYLACNYMNNLRQGWILSRTPIGHSHWLIGRKNWSLPWSYLSNWCKRCGKIRYNPSSLICCY